MKSRSPVRVFQLCIGTWVGIGDGGDDNFWIGTIALVNRQCSDVFVAFDIF